MVNNIPQPINDYILYKNEIHSSLILANPQPHMYSKGKIVAKGNKTSPEISIGQNVLVRTSATELIKHEGVEYFLCRESAIVALLPQKEMLN